jgi:hypothetical protein
MVPGHATGTALTKTSWQNGCQEVFIVLQDSGAEAKVFIVNEKVNVHLFTVNEKVYGPFCTG